MDHVEVLKEPGRYTAFPVLEALPDGRLAVGCISSPFGDHHGLADWVALVSADQGRTWWRSDELALPPNWPGDTPRERYDRLCRILPDGSFAAIGSVGYEAWPLGRRAEAEARGLRATEHEHLPGMLLVSGHRLVALRSVDRGASWERQTWTVPGYQGFIGFPRGTVLADGTWLFPLYAGTVAGTSDCLVWRWREGDLWDLRLAVPRIGGEWALVEVAPGRVLGHVRSGYRWGRPEDDRIYALEVWSDDGGLTWTYPVETRIQGYPNHLLRLRDGRLLCTTGYRRDPMGVRAVLSEDGGRTWDLDRTYVLRDDGGTPSASWTVDHGSGSPDVGYPVSAELANGAILSVYYITSADGVTHVAATRWHPDRDVPGSDG